MKKYIILFAFFLFAIYSYSQECTTLWPYVYPEFMEGTLIVPGGKEHKGHFNIHVQESKLHYLEKGIIKEANSFDVLIVKIESDTYMNFMGQIMKVIGSESRGFVATLILGDFDKLFNSSGAYGASSNSSATMKLSSIDIGGKSIINHMELRQNRVNGLQLPLKFKYFIVTKGVVYPAKKKDILSKLDKQEASEFKKFVKTNKIKWTNPESLLKILDFFNKE